jgi:hypothetical protein
MSLHPDVERLARLGWRLHPSCRTTRAACIKNAAELATANLGQIEQWTTEFPGCNWRVTMSGSGIWALDVDAPGSDHRADGIRALSDLVATYGRLPDRPMVRTGGGGYCLFFAYHGEPIAGRTGTPAPGLDPRRGQLSVTVPPSIHHRTRLPYRWLVPPWTTIPPAAPDWLLRLLQSSPQTPGPTLRRGHHTGNERSRSYALAALRRSVEQIAIAPAGQRNDTLNAETWRIARFIQPGVLTALEIAEALAHAGRIAGLNKLEVQHTLASALAAGARQ